MSLSIGGPGPALPSPLRPDPADGADAAERSDSATREGASSGAAQGAAAFRGSTLPYRDAGGMEHAGVDGTTASPSARVDPELWALLGGEERAFYLRNSITSPATYGPAASPGAARPGARVGVRLDVRA